MNTDHHLDVAAEVCIAATAESLMQDLSRRHPSWHTEYNRLNSECGTRAELVRLLDTAPNAFAFGVCYGKFVLRIEVEAMTGRPFE